MAKFTALCTAGGLSINPKVVLSWVAKTSYYIYCSMHLTVTELALTSLFIASICTH